jgi:hypothetical protein
MPDFWSETKRRFCCASSCTASTTDGVLSFPELQICTALGIFARFLRIFDGRSKRHLCALSSVFLTVILRAGLRFLCARFFGSVLCRRW